MSRCTGPALRSLCVFFVFALLPRQRSLVWPSRRGPVARFRGRPHSASGAPENLKYGRSVELYRPSIHETIARFPQTAARLPNLVCYTDQSTTQNLVHPASDPETVHAGPFLVLGAIPRHFPRGRRSNDALFSLFLRCISDRWPHRAQRGLRRCAAPVVRHRRPRFSPLPFCDPGCLPSLRR